MPNRPSDVPAPHAAHGARRARRTPRTPHAVHAARRERRTRTPHGQTLPSESTGRCHCHQPGPDRPGLQCVVRSGIGSVTRPHQRAGNRPPRPTSQTQHLRFPASLRLLWSPRSTYRLGADGGPQAASTGLRLAAASCTYCTNRTLPPASPPPLEEPEGCVGHVQGAGPGRLAGSRCCNHGKQRRHSEQGSSLTMRAWVHCEWRPSKDQALPC